MATKVHYNILMTRSITLFSHSTIWTRITIIYKLLASTSTYFDLRNLNFYLQYFYIITIHTLLTIRVTYTESTITRLLAIRVTYTTNNTILTLFAEHTVTYNYLHYILALRREEYFSINHLIKEKFSRSYLMSNLLIKSWMEMARLFNLFE